MNDLKKATLTQLANDDSGDEIGDPIEVQFNPTTLKLQISSNMAKGKPTGSQVRESTGATTTTLSLDLVFDTADEGDTTHPRSVRERTGDVERFVLPLSPSKEKPPKLRFQWGSFFIDGAMSSVSIDFDLFAADGTPLRAKVGLSILEQNSKYIFLQSSLDDADRANAPTPLGVSVGAVGSAGGFSAQVSAALGGESLPEFAARLGLDPTAWRGLSTDISGRLSGELSLQAGAEIGFSADLTASAGIGLTLGAEAGVSASLETSFGLDASAGVNAGISAVAGVGAGPDLSAGFSLTAAGGVGAALATVQNVKAEEAGQQARQSFGQAAANTPSPAASARPSLPEQDHTPLTVSGILSPSQQFEAPAAPPPPKVDPRAASFGLGVPLRPTVGNAAEQRSATLSGRVSLRSQVGTGLPPVTDDPTTAPWVALRRRPASGTTAAPGRARPCGCGCQGMIHR
jgi:Contractile injection system tube protein